MLQVLAIVYSVVPPHLTVEWVTDMSQVSSCTSTPVCCVADLHLTVSSHTSTPGCSVAGLHSATLSSPLDYFPSRLPGTAVLLIWFIPPSPPPSPSTHSPNLPTFSFCHVVEKTEARLVWELLFVGYLTSQQHASVSQGRICSVLRAATLR